MDKDKDRQLRILMIGPLPPPTGGTRVLFSNLLSALRGHEDVQITVMETPPVRKQKVRAFFHTLSQAFRILRVARRVDVITLHTTTSALHVRGPFIRLIASLNHVPFLIHTFGGSLYREEYGGIRSWFIRTALCKTSVYLAESREQVASARDDGVRHAEWFPNTRPLPVDDEGLVPSHRSCRRFVFISHVKQTKGIHELIAAAERFEKEVAIDVYGPFRDGMTAAAFDGCKRVRYRGELAPDEVMDTLKQYDALLLPTYHPGEGYPGIVIEAYMVGLPVICTRWRRLPEIVDDSSGILVEPKNAQSLYEAMKALTNDTELFTRLREGAFAKRKQFDTAVWADRFVDLCREAVESRQE